MRPRTPTPCAAYSNAYLSVEPFTREGVMSDHEGRDEDAAYERYLSRRRGCCEECGCYGDHDPLCPWAPEPDHDGDGDIVQGTVLLSGELLREVRDAA